ncbi:hypothetical protein FE782_21525 [Paenibacillus antri]|uniref:Uncharacterized protein n=1 Tax=Paenibacillus antri TaxID=2582848 RepID=A0A5R9G5D0_9BACL|nr:hypothetical protein [Paenibacillus antri]TLS50249.1 hypothetical protein FE782_21525 [Paenibacillus antri]
MAITSTTNYYEWLGMADRQEELRETVERIGYDAFRVLVDQLEKALKEVEEGGFDDYAARLAAGERLFPEPSRFSPTWQVVWAELGEKLRWKRYAYEAVSSADREGEWQIVMDNPFTNNEVVCYPTLSFIEAAYLFGYFKPTLEKNEYLRLQKVVNALQLTGE